MSADSHHQSNPELPPEMVRAVVRNGTQDANDVGDFLDHIFAMDGSPFPKPTHLPTLLLLRLGVGCQLLRWESRGILLHKQLGLPDGWAVIREALIRVSGVAGPQVDPNPGIEQRVLQLSLDQLSWTAPDLLGADIVLGDVDEDALAISVADLLWATSKNIEASAANRE